MDRRPLTDEEIARADLCLRLQLTHDASLETIRDRVDQLFTDLRRRSVSIEWDREGYEITLPADIRI